MCSVTTTLWQRKDLLCNSHSMACREKHRKISSCTEKLYLDQTSLWCEEYRQIWKHIFLGLQMRLNCNISFCTTHSHNDIYQMVLAAMGWKLVASTQHVFFDDQHVMSHSDYGLICPQAIELPRTCNTSKWSADGRGVLVELIIV
jgi:hypothetical protein